MYWLDTLWLHVHWPNVHSTAVVAGSAVVQAVATVVLVCVTIWYARHTRASAKAAGESADAARAGVAEMQQQRRDNVRPVVVTMEPKFLHDGGAELRHYEFRVDVINVGAFTAFDIQLNVNSAGFSPGQRPIAYLLPYRNPGDTPRQTLVVKTADPVPVRDFGGIHEFTITYRDVMGNRCWTLAFGEITGQDVGGSRHVQLRDQAFECAGSKADVKIQQMTSDGWLRHELHERR